MYQNVNKRNANFLYPCHESNVNSPKNNNESFDPNILFNKSNNPFFKHLSRQMIVHKERLLKQQ